MFYELSVCPLLLNSKKVYFASSLIAKPNIEAVWNKKNSFENWRPTSLSQYEAIMRSWLTTFKDNISYSKPALGIS